ncbi:MAG: hypothetical protein JXR97_00150 [Planctomycetes bacterium]|nr:hypothetical protein [Planctomycetota bacterium]
MKIPVACLASMLSLKKIPAWMLARIPRESVKVAIAIIVGIFLFPLINRVILLFAEIFMPRPHASSGKCYMLYTA